MAPNPEELTHFIAQVIANKEVRVALQDRNYKKAFQLAKVPGPTKEQEVALMALEQSWPTLHALGTSFNAGNFAN